VNNRGPQDSTFKRFRAQKRTSRRLLLCVCTQTRFALSKLALGRSSLQIIGLAISFATSIIAALSDKEDFERWAKYALVILPLIASLVSSILTQLRLYDLWKLREDGRIRFQDLSIEGERRAAAANSDEECTQLRQELQLNLMK